MQHTAVVTLAEPPELLARAATGDQAAWDELVERFGRLVWAVARGASGSSGSGSSITR